MNGITYFRLKSDYDGDTTKDCGLTGQEIDNNFYVLEGRDVKSLEVDGDDIAIVLYNGDRITAENALSGYAKDLSFDFDKENGTLIIKQGEQVVQTISGFDCADCGKIYTDMTLIGDGTKENPLGVSSMAQTGHYKPVNGIIDKTTQYMPEPSGVGDRYIVKNEISNYGRLYNYCGVNHISCMLQCENSEWRIPKRTDWNEMLNALEPDGERNHGAKDAYGHYYSNKFLGKYAGKFLKSECGWDDCNESQDGGCDCEENCPDGCGGTNPCMHMNCNHEQSQPSGITPESTEPYDCYGINFNAMPLGKVESGTSVAVGKRAYFWTGCNRDNEAFIKALDYCKNGVLQEIVSKDNFYSLRLVKEYNGDNYYGQEEIGEQVFETSIIPYITENGEQGYRVWTTVNVGIDTPCGDVQPTLESDCEDLTTVYSIAEWNGHHWIYKRLEEGETVTVLCDDDNCDYVDYMLVHGELVEAVHNYDGDISELTNRIENLEDRMSIVETTTQNIQNSIEEINNNITSIQTQVETNTQAIEAHTSQIEDLSERLSNLEERADNVDALIEALGERITSIENFLQNGLIDANDRNANNEDDYGDVININGNIW